MVQYQTGDSDFDPFGLKEPPAPRQAGERPRTTLGQVAKRNAIVRRKNAGVGEDGLLDKDREDEEIEGFRPGTSYRPFDFPNR